MGGCGGGVRRGRAVLVVMLGLLALPAAALAQPVVTVTATDPDAAELGPDAGTFTFTRDDTTGGLTVTFTVGGTASEIADYAAIGTTVNFDPGSPTAMVTITPATDALLEGDETVVLTLVDDVAYDLGPDTMATVTIADDPPPTTTTSSSTSTSSSTTSSTTSAPTTTTTSSTTTSTLPVVTVAATDPDAAELGLDPGTFTFTRVGDTAPGLTVGYMIGGTATNGADYAAIITIVDFDPGSATAVVTITPTADALAEGDETVTLTLDDGGLYDLGPDTTATVTIADDPPPTTTTSSSTSTSSSTTSSTTTSSSTVPTTSSTSSSTTTTTSSTTTSTLPVVTVTATDPDAAETGPDAGTFTFTRVGDTTAALTVSFMIGGTATNGADYATASSIVGFDAGSPTATVTITPTNDPTVEGAETVILTLTDGADYDLGAQITDTVTIADNPIPVVTVVATDPDAAEIGSDPGTVTFTRAGDLTFALTVSYAISGTATNGVDYPIVGSIVDFAPGSPTAMVTITPVNDAPVEGNETVIFTLVDGAQYDVGAPAAATVTITDNAVPVVTVQATDAAASEVGPNPGTFTFTRTGDATFGLAISYTLGGTATNGGDYSVINTIVDFAAGSATVVVTVTPATDALVEGNETVVLTLVDGPGYDLGAQTTATVTIADGPPPTTTSTSSSTTTTSTTSSSTTSSTTMPPPNLCGDILDGPTFASIECRLTALRERVIAEDGLGDFRSKLSAKLVKLLLRTSEGMALCQRNDLARTRKRLKQIAQGLTAYRRLLASNAARTRIDPAVRASFVDAGEPLKSDALVLRGRVICPADAATTTSARTHLRYPRST